MNAGLSPISLRHLIRQTRATAIGMLVVDPDDRIVGVSDYIGRLYRRFPFQNQPRYREWLEFNCYEWAQSAPDRDHKYLLDAVDKQRAVPRTVNLIGTSQNGKILIGDHTTRPDGYQLNRRLIVPISEIVPYEMVSTIESLLQRLDGRETPFCLVTEDLFVVKGNKPMLGLMRAEVCFRETASGLTALCRSDHHNLAGAVKAAIDANQSLDLAMDGWTADRLVVRVEPACIPTLAGMSRVASLTILGDRIAT